MSGRAAGALLFLPVPGVLLLFTQQPLGPAWSLGLGVALMVTHRFYARPFALGRAERRCLWCGGAAGQGPGLELQEPFGATRWRACGPDHAGRLGRVFGWAHAHGFGLKLGILGSLAVFLPAALLAGLGRLGPVTSADAVAFFRGGIALTVLPLGWLAAGRGLLQAPPSKVPFPVHIQALIGTAGVLWLFRLIGIAWLALAVLHLTRRLGLGGI